MIKNTSKLAGWAASSLALIATAFADVKVNDHISINGYAVGALTHTDLDSGGDIGTYFESKGSPAITNADAVKLGVLGTAGSVSAYGSILYLPGAANEAGLLDAYATFNTGSGVKITGGKFLSYLGYEAFDPINMTQLTYGSTIYAVPAYHTGAKIDFSGETFSFGVAALDSVFSGPRGFFEGDREYDDDMGFEAMFSYTGIKNLTVFAGIAYENTAGVMADDLFIFDLWVSYALTDKITIAAEYDTQNDVLDAYLAQIGYKFSDKFSMIFRASTAEWDNGTSEAKYTVAPTYTINSNFAVRAEYSEGDGYSFIGGQVIFKF